MQIKVMIEPQDIAQCFEAFLELRPSLTDKQAFVDQVLAQQKEGYQIVAVFHEDQVVACIGFRIMTFLAWGKILYIDDLITREAFRGKGYGKALLTYATDFAVQNGCGQVHLDTGYARYAAHKAYLTHGFELHCHHLALQLG